MSKLDRIYIGFEEGLEKAIKVVKEAGKEAFILTDRILYEKDLARLKDRIKPIEGLLDGIVVSNLGTLNWVKDNFDLDIHGDIGLNVFNSFTARTLAEYGLISLTLSPELNIKQIENICTRHPFDYETIAYGYLPLMVMKHCPMSLLKGCKEDSNCKNCNLAKGYGLKDRMGLNFYMERKGHTTTIYNSVPLMVLDSVKQLYSKGVNIIRLDFTFEKEGIREIQEIYYGYAKGLVSKDEVMKYIEDFRKTKEITRGHYFRGVI